MPLPSMKEQFAALIAAPSVSCTQASLDQTNRPVIDLLAGWLGDLGFAIDIQQVSPGKFNLLATFGTGPGGLVLAGHSDTRPPGPVPKVASRLNLPGLTCWISQAKPRSPSQVASRSITGRLVWSSEAWVQLTEGAAISAADCSCMDGSGMGGSSVVVHWRPIIGPSGLRIKP